MSNSKLNRIGFMATAATVFAIAVVQGCSSSDNQASPSPTGGSGGVTSTGGKGGSTSTAGKDGASGGSTSTAGNGGMGGSDVTIEGGAAGATSGGMCEPAEDHGEAAYLAAHGNKLPTL